MNQVKSCDMILSCMLLTRAALRANAASIETTASGPKSCLPIIITIIISTKPSCIVKTITLSYVHMLIYIYIYIYLIDILHLLLCVFVDVYVQAGEREREKACERERFLRARMNDRVSENEAGE